jgi:secondary thiamine-phosphate synthase enzyme
MRTFDVRTSEREVLVDVTDMVRQAAQEAGVESGWAHVFCPHTTAAVTINESADPDVPKDIIDGLSDIAPRARKWRHREGNADAHVKAALVGESVLIPIEDGRLVLGTWQGVFFCEFDGPRSRRIHVSVGGS